MIRFLTRVVCLSILLLPIALLPARAETFEVIEMETPAGAVEIYAGQILVKFSEVVTPEEIDQVNASRGCATASKSSVSGFHILDIPEGADEFAVAEQYMADANCEWASPNFVSRTHDHAPFPIPVDDPNRPFLTHLDIIDVETAWAKQIGSEDVVVAVIDSGVAYEDRAIPAYEAGGVLPGKTTYLRAPDMMQTHFVPGFDFIYGDANANDDRFHGTAVAAIIAGDTNNAFRNASISPGSTIMPIKTNDFTGVGPLSGLIDGINFATAAGVDVINMSLGFQPGASDPMFDPFFTGLDAALEAAHDAGIVIVASSGNAGVGVVSRPALHPDVIAVGASNFDGLTLAGYSQTSTLESFVFGAPIPPTPGLPGSIEIVGPVGAFQDLDSNGLPDAVIAEMIVPNCPDAFGSFLLTGTSFSAPQVSAVVASMIAEGRRPVKDGLGVDIIRQILRETATDLGAAGNDLTFGAGQLNAGLATCTETLTICHKPDMSNQTKVKKVGAARGHLGHGDTFGPCS